MTDENIPKTIRREDYLRCATQKALEILSHNADSVGRGFVLMVEGSLIDGASHGNDEATRRPTSPFTFMVRVRGILLG